MSSVDYARSDMVNGVGGRDQSQTMIGKKGGLRQSDVLRIDRSGTKIEKGVKTHKITFADTIEPNNDKEKPKLTDVYVVESYKKYNSENTYAS
jgi:hypothetical protein